MSDSTLSQTIAGAIILLAVIVSVVILAWRKVLSGAEAYGMLVTIISIGGGAFAVHAGAKIGAAAASSGAADPKAGRPGQGGA